MPGLITHHYILKRALGGFPSTVPAMHKVHTSHNAVLDHATKSKDGYKQYVADAACLPASCAYMGSCGPDMFYLEFGQKGAFIADLMHYNRTGLYTIHLLRQVKQHINKVNAGLRNDLLHLLAYAMGHVSHIAADITIHPYVNSIVAAYADNPPDTFQDNNRLYFKNLWKFHNILEHYQDAYVLHRLFYGLSGFQRDWEYVNIATGAAEHFKKDANKGYWFLTRNAKQFYGFTIALDADDGFERDKYNFFTSTNWIIDVNSYYQSTIPTFDTMNRCPRLVQGGTFNSSGSYLTRGLFDQYLEHAAAQTRTFWSEIEAYLLADQTDFQDPDYSVEKQYCKTLRRHWNLDCGLAPGAVRSPTSWPIPNVPDTRMYLSGRLRFQSAVRVQMGDLT